MRKRLCRRAAIACLLALAGASSARAYEVDNFTGRDTLLSRKGDALAALDGKVEWILARAAREANRASSSHCNRVMLRQEILRYVGPDPVSWLEGWASLSHEIDHLDIGRGDSIYAEATLQDGPMLFFAGIGKSIKVAGHVIGTDKLGHFFMQGYQDWKEVDDGRTIDEVVRDDRSEDGIFGILTTGVKSYADLATNAAGYRFWRDLVSGGQPYFRCEDERRWVRGRRFTWADHVTDAWDEAINCSEFKPSLAPKVEARLRAIGMRCPVEPAKCAALSRLEHAEFVVSPKCRAAAR